MPNYVFQPILTATINVTFASSNAGQGVAFNGNIGGSGFTHIRLTADQIPAYGSIFVQLNPIQNYGGMVEITEPYVNNIMIFERNGGDYGFSTNEGWLVGRTSASGLSVHFTKVELGIMVEMHNVIYHANAFEEYTGTVPPAEEHAPWETVTIQKNIGNLESENYYLAGWSTTDLTVEGDAVFLFLPSGELETPTFVMLYQNVNFWGYWLEKTGNGNGNGNGNVGLGIICSLFLLFLFTMIFAYLGSKI